MIPRLPFMLQREEIALNQATWRTVKGNAPYPGAVRRFGHGARDDDDDAEEADDLLPLRDDLLRQTPRTVGWLSNRTP
jgi:hypothetical protein